MSIEELAILCAPTVKVPKGKAINTCFCRENKISRGAELSK